MLISPDGAAVLKLSATGQLTINDTATGQVKMLVGPFSSCKGPFTLQLLGNGLLALVDKSRAIVWSSTSACLGSSTCYSYQLRGDGQLVVTDGFAQPVWLSGDGWSSSTASAHGWLHQITSGAQVRISCIYAAPTQLGSKLVSMSQRYQLQLAQPLAALQVYDTANQTQLWSPAVSSSPGTTPKQLCISTNGVLTLIGSGLASMWSSGAPALLFGPYTAMVTDDGCLEVLDGSCNSIYTSHTQSRKLPRAVRTPANINGRFPVLNTVATDSSSTGGGGTTSKPVNATRQLLQQPPPKQLAVRPSRQLPPPPIVQLQHGFRKAAPPPKPSQVRPAASIKSAKACTLGQLGICGGITMCAVDNPCTSAGCCMPGLACRRSNRYTWRCMP